MLRNSTYFVFLMSGLLLASCSHEKPKETYFYGHEDPRRGAVSIFDPGPDPSGPWGPLFQDLPDYQKLGRDLFPESSPFALSLGPSLYRGRLGAGQVKVFVTGLDERGPLPRAFSSALGKRLQNFLNLIGIRYSYLFLNSSAYPIDSRVRQNPKLLALFQDLNSPIVLHRNKLFDTMAEQNTESLALIVAVGNEGKNALATWVRSKGGTCESSQNLFHCDTKVLEQKFKLRHRLTVIGIPRPSMGLASGNAGFKAAFNQVTESITKDPTWLPVDNEQLVYPEGAKVLPAPRISIEKQFPDKESPLPHWDFPFGTSLAVGSLAFEGIAATGELLFRPKQKTSSSWLPVENPGHVKFDQDHPIPELSKNDLPYLWSSDFDPGPCGRAVTCKMASLLEGLEFHLNWPNFDELGARTNALLGNSALYRGRLNEAHVLVLADKGSPDDFFTGRFLTGENGQKLQSFLNAMGIIRSYAIVPLLPIDSSTVSKDKEEQLIEAKEVKKLRRAIIESILRSSGTRVVLLLGPLAEKAWSQMGFATKAFAIKTPDDKAHQAEWNQVLKEISTFQYHLDKKASYQYVSVSTPIPRFDLPAHTVRWLGSTGDHATLSLILSEGLASYTLQSPEWVLRLTGESN